MQDRIAIIYGSTEGQTQKIAQYIYNKLHQRGADVVMLHADELPLDYEPQNSDAYVLAASVHEGRHQRYLVDFVRNHAEAINEKPSLFLSVCLSQAMGEQNEAGTYIDGFREATGYKGPAASVAGALRYLEYSWLKRSIMQRIARAHEPEADTDTSQNHEYTDWNALDVMVEDFFDRLHAKA